MLPAQLRVVVDHPDPDVVGAVLRLAHEIPPGGKKREEVLHLSGIQTGSTGAPTGPCRLSIPEAISLLSGPECRESAREGIAAEFAATVAPVEHTGALYDEPGDGSPRDRASAVGIGHNSVVVPANEASGKGSIAHDAPGAKRLVHSGTVVEAYQSPQVRIAANRSCAGTPRYRAPVIVPDQSSDLPFAPDYPLPGAPHQIASIKSRETADIASAADRGAAAGMGNPPAVDPDEAPNALCTDDNARRGTG